MGVPIRADAQGGPLTGTSVTTSPAIACNTNDLLVATSLASAQPRVTSVVWSNGDTNNRVFTTPSGLPSITLDYAIPGANGTTTVQYNLSLSENLNAIVASLIPANPAAAPTLNGTSVANGAFAGAGPGSITLGSYTTVLNDCIVMCATGGNLSPVPTFSGAGATWTNLIAPAGSGSAGGFLAFGFGCTAGATSFTFAQTSGTATYAVAVFSGVAAPTGGDLIAMIV